MTIGENLRVTDVHTSEGWKNDQRVVFAVVTLRPAGSEPGLLIQQMLNKFTIGPMLLSEQETHFPLGSIARLQLVSNQL